MTPLKTITFSSPTGEKTISVYNADITSATEHIDVMTISAFAGDYIATERSVIGALNTVGISVSSLSKAPEIDLRGLCNVWLS